MIYPSPPPPGGAPARADAAPPVVSPDGRWLWDGRAWRPAPSPWPPWVRPYRSAFPMAVLLTVCLVVDLAAWLAIGFFNLAVYVPVLGRAFSVPVWEAIAVLALLALFGVGYLGVPGAIAAWSFVAYGNLRPREAAPPGWSPAWAAGGWFVPVLNLAVPCLVVREVWRAERSSAGGALLWTWWAAWLVRDLALVLWVLLGAGVIQLGAGAYPLLLLFITLTRVLAGGLTLGVAHRVTHLQDAELRSAGALADDAVPGWARPPRPIAVAAGWAIAALAVASGGNLLRLPAAAVSVVDPLRTVGAPLVVLADVGALLLLLGLAGGAVAVAIWSFQAYRNLPALGARRLQWTPAWAAAAWFLPVGGLGIPYWVARDLAGGAGALLRAWWAAWVASLLLYAVNDWLLVGGTTGLLVAVVNLADTVALLAAGALGVLVIRAITAAQTRASA